MVVASPAVEAAVQQRNGLTIADLLRPSGYFHHLSGELSPVQRGLERSLEDLHPVQDLMAWHVPA